VISANLAGKSATVMTVLVTGAAGFIGFSVAAALLARGEDVIGFDNFDSYYDVRLKEARAAELARHAAFRMVRGAIAEPGAFAAAISDPAVDRVVHLAAQAGVRYSIRHPDVYIRTNVVGHFNVVEACRRRGGIRHLVYASSSSVYGGNEKLPFSVDDKIDRPVSLYAATKAANELIGHCYSHLYGLPATGLRFFTVYGPWGRPDMALWIFTKAILEGRPIPVFNNGEMRRDFTYVDDIVEGIVRTLDRPARPNPAFDAREPDPGTSSAPWRVYNIGNSRPVELLDYIAAIERCTGRKATMNLLPLQPGDVPDTMADVAALESDTGYRPGTPVETGVERFVAWYRSYHGV